MKDTTFTFTKKELMEMWKRPKERQYMIADAKIIEAFNLTSGNIAISWSGGKDSTVLLYRVAVNWVTTYGKRPLVVIFADTTNEHHKIYKFIKWFIPYLEERTGVVIDFHTARPRDNQTYISVVRDYGVPLISKDVSKSVRRIRLWLKECNLTWEDVKNYTQSDMESVSVLQKLGCNKALILNLTGYISSTGYFSRKYKLAKRWFPLIPAEEIIISEKCCYHLKEIPLADIGKVAKCENFMTGEMAHDSKRRENAYLMTGCNFVTKGILKSKPFGAMTEQTLLWIIDYDKIPQSEYYGELLCKNGEYCFSEHCRGGCSLCGFGIEHEPDRFISLQKDEPAKVQIAFTPKSKGGLGYLEACQFLNENCGMNIVIPQVDEKEYKISSKIDIPKKKNRRKSN